MNSHLISAIGLIGLSLTALATVANAETPSRPDWLGQIQTAANEASRNEQFMRQRQEQSGVSTKQRVREREQVRTNEAAANQAKRERAMRREQIRHNPQSGPQTPRATRGSGKMQRGKR